MTDLRIGPALVVPVTSDPFTGYVEVTGGEITHLGPKPTGGPATETVAAPGRIVTPAFVNTHCHTSQQLGRGLGDDVGLLTWLHERIWPYELALDESDSELSALVCAIEQIRNGCTLLADPGGRHVDGMARGIAAVGIRALLGRSAMDCGDGRPEGDRETTAEVLAAQDELAERWHGKGLLRFSYTLRTIFNCSDELIAATLERARALGTVVQMHVAEIPEENEHALATRGATTVRHLDRLGALGPGFLAVHSTWVDDEEIALLAERGCPVSHNAASNLKILGTPRVADMLDAGVRVALGTDGAPSNNRMSVLDEMWLAAIVQKGVRRDPTVLPAPIVLRMATVDGATALGMGDLVGSLEVGKRADLVVLDPYTPNLATAADPVSALVTACKSENVESVLCDGDWVMRDRRLTRVDEAAVLAEAAARAAAVRRRLQL
ncbi:MAG TPA: amidohydrolase [Pseudonocardia sp.]|jgi:5-methylthioadenosine/S-adenosylhomocysteine deaminase|uniref:amidohydrolase family protein n=1 Tax=Pseudonocardia sp. TaxID=60912 RepID=UPI002B4AFF41|nr:amidohydrolase [Pseudonocardia sp.]HLU55154.1 amidohydrolase [Pseudonocardia sp.]